MAKFCHSCSMPLEAPEEVDSLEPAQAGRVPEGSGSVIREGNEGPA